MTMPTVFRALAHANFRLYILGQGASIVGSWMQQVAMAWLVYQLTGSPLWLGAVAFAGQIPALFLTPLAGCLIDRLERRRLLYVTQTLAMVQALGLAALALCEVVQPWHILALSFFLGAVNALDIPTRQSFLRELVGNGPDLANAIALNSSVFNGARLLGPALAGLLLALTSPGVCFLVNGASYAAVLAALCAMRLEPRARSHPASRFYHDLREGLSYAWQSMRIRSLLLLIGFFNMAGMAESALLPIVATEVLHGHASSLAILAASAGLGAFLAAVLLACRRGTSRLEPWIARASTVYAVALLAFSYVTTLWAAASCLCVSGFALLYLTAATNTVLQTTVDDGKRGRIVSLYTMMVTGLAPIGGLLAGIVTEYLGAPLTLRAAASVCLGVALLQRTLHPYMSLHSPHCQSAHLCATQTAEQAA